MSFALMAAPYSNFSAKNGKNSKSNNNNNQITKCSARKKKTIKNQPSSKNIEVQNIIDKIHNLGSDDSFQEEDDSSLATFQPLAPPALNFTVKNTPEITTEPVHERLGTPGDTAGGPVGINVDEPEMISVPQEYLESEIEARANPISLTGQPSQYYTPDASTVYSASKHGGGPSEPSNLSPKPAPANSNEFKLDGKVHAMKNVKAALYNGDREELMRKLNYMIELLEASQDERTGHVTEDVLLYSFLGIFIIFVIDSFARAGKYVR